MPSSIKSAKVSVDQVSFGEEQLVSPDVPLDIDAEFGGKEARLRLERKLLRKLDMRMSILVLIYILNYVRLGRSCLASSLCSNRPTGRSIVITLRKSRDVRLVRPDAQGAFSAARLKGFEADLHLKGQQFNTILSILYVGYILMQIPS